MHYFQHHITVLLIGVLILIGGTSISIAQEMQNQFGGGIVQPRAPLGPGVPQYNLKGWPAPNSKEKSPYSWMAPNFEPYAMAPARQPGAGINYRQSQSTIDGLKFKSRYLNVIVPKSPGQILINSFAAVQLTIQLFKPNQKKWTKIQMAPTSPTLVNCDECESSFKIAFFDGQKQVILTVKAGVTINIRPDTTGAIWQLEYENN